MGADVDRDDVGVVAGAAPHDHAFAEDDALLDRAQLGEGEVEPVALLQAVERVRTRRGHASAASRFKSCSYSAIRRLTSGASPSRQPGGGVRAPRDKRDNRAWLIVERLQPSAAARSA